jgi:hypothetical protein
MMLKKPMQRKRLARPTRNTRRHTAADRIQLGSTPLLIWTVQLGPAQISPQNDWTGFFIERLNNNLNTLEARNTVFGGEKSCLKFVSIIKCYTGRKLPLRPIIRWDDRTLAW